MPTDDNTPSSPPKGPVLALILVIALVAGGIWLQRHMRANAQMEDCMMAGRRNCDAAVH